MRERIRRPHPCPLLKERGTGTDAPSLEEKGLGDEVNNWMMGIAKAAVLPVPV
jgi:hypothetical protein